MPADGRAYWASMREITAGGATRLLPGAALLLPLCWWRLVVNGADVGRSPQRADVGPCRFLTPTQVDHGLGLWEWSEGQELLLRSRVPNARHDASGHLLVRTGVAQLGGAGQALQPHIEVVEGLRCALAALAEGYPIERDVPLGPDVGRDTVQDLVRRHGISGKDAERDLDHLPHGGIKG